MSSDDPLPDTYFPCVVISSDNFVLYGLNPATLERLWEFSMPSDTFAVPANVKILKPSPLVYGDFIYQAAVNSDTIYKINAKTGKLVKKMWINDGHTTVSPPAHYFTVMGTPIADGKMIYVPTANGVGPGGTLFAIDTGTAAVQWKFVCPDGSPFVSAPVIYKDKIYIASQGIANNGHIYGLSKANGPDGSGNPLWDYPGLGLSDTTNTFNSSPTISDPYIYVGGYTDSNVYCIYLNPPPSATTPPVPEFGKLRWTYKTNGNILSSPTAYAGMCIVGSNDFYVHCIDSQTAIARWKFKTGSQINSSPIISNQVCYIGSYDYGLYAINILNGKQKWKFPTTGLVKSSPVPYKGNVYIGSYDGYIYKVDSAFGTLQAKFKVNGNIQSSPAVQDYSGIQYNSGVSGHNTSGNNN
jgi:outer membrane protein assembly factor BamB